MDFLDQTGYKITLNRHPIRIVSLVPSQTELLYFLGIQPIAQTIFCVHPPNHFKNAIKIGGTKKIKIEKIKSLNPDLIIGNKEENQKEQIEELRKDFPVWLSDIYNVDDATSMILEIGKITDRFNLAQNLSSKISAGLNDILKRHQKERSTLYLIWKDPYMAAGRNTFIHSILQTAGYETVLADKHTRYPEVSKSQLVELNPSTILLSSEPYPFKEKHIKELKELLPNSNIKLVDGELFSWYGPRLLKTIDYLKSKKSFL